MSQLRSLIEGIDHRAKEEDRWLRPLDSNAIYSVISAYTTLHQLRTGNVVDDFLMEIWRLIFH